MQQAAFTTTTFEMGHPIKTVLVVDDSRLQRRILSSMLTRWGFHVVEAGTGQEALDLCLENCPDMVFSDWMMPGMTGLEFLVALRANFPDTYIYFILLTSKSEKNDIAIGLESGADDFLAKPVNAPELRARISAGARILSMQRELEQRNSVISSTLDKLRDVYAAINNDLNEAKKLQQSLIREPQIRFGDFQITQILRSSGHVGGDLVGFFPAGSRHVGLYGIDVSGHGISSALFTARLAGFFHRNRQSITLPWKRRPKGKSSPAPWIKLWKR